MYDGDPFRRAGYVASPHAQCASRGCQAGALIATIDSSQQLMREAINREERRAVMREPTRSLWCERGGHSFSEKDPGRQVQVITTFDEYGGQNEEGFTVCGGCIAPGAGRPAVTRPQLATGGSAADAPGPRDF